MKTRAPYKTNHPIFILCEQSARDKPFSNKKWLSYKTIRQPSLILPIS